MIAMLTTVSHQASPSILVTTRRTIMARATLIGLRSEAVVVHIGCTVTDLDVWLLEMEVNLTCDERRSYLYNCKLFGAN